MNYAKLGMPLFEGHDNQNQTSEVENGLRGVGGGAFQRKDRQHQVKYQASRWFPAIKDVIEQAIEGKLCNRQFPYLSDRRENRGQSRTGNYRMGRGAITGPSRIIVFVLVGMG